MPRTLKGALIGVGAVVVSTLAIQASDLIRGIDGSLVGLVEESNGPCGDGAVSMQFGAGTLCVDAYEAVASEGCPHPSPANPAQTSANLLSTECVPVSEAERIPWRFVSHAEAEQLCARVGKRLPTNEEWHRLVLQQVDQSNCHINADAPAETGEAECQTNAGVHDLIGNVWEWVDGSVTDGRFAERTLPGSGYVHVTDNNGIVVETQAEPNITHGEDYAWTSSAGVFGIIRGGYFGSGSDAGIYAQNLSAPFDLRTSGVGFRCVRSL